MIKNRQYSIQLVLLILDFISIIIGLFAAFHIRYNTDYGVQKIQDSMWLVSYVLIIYMALWVLVNFNKHFFERSALDEFMAVFKADILLGVTLTTLLFVIHRSSDISRLVFGYFLIINLCLQYFLRVTFKYYMLKVYKHSKSASRLILVTSEAKVEDVLTDLENHEDWFRQVVGIILTDKAEYGDKSYHNIPVVADSDDLLNYCIQNPVDEVFIVDTGKNVSSKIKFWVQDLEMMGVIVNVNIGEFDLSNYGNKALTHVGHYATVSFARNVYSTRQLVLKRCLDICGALVGMILLGIAYIFVAPAIKLDSPGPVVFGQTRVGKNGRKFKFYKFRSMYIDAEERKKALMAQNEVQGLMFKMENDPRITKVGKFLRETSIDELPQFVNVLKGDMSLVGTRPPTIDEYEQYEANHKCRLSMTPGLTGMWQVSGRSDIKNFDEVVELDMQYIDNWTIMKDIKILIQTVLVVVCKKGSR